MVRAVALHSAQTDGRRMGTAIDTVAFTAEIVAEHTVRKGILTSSPPCRDRLALENRIDNYRPPANGDRVVVRYPRPMFEKIDGRPSPRYESETTVGQIGIALDHSALFAC